MKYLLTLFTALLISFGSFSQKLVKDIDKQVQLSEIKSHLYFLASDELRGRNTGTIENEIAARYIAERFRSYGVKMAPGMDSYFQPVSLIKEVSPQKATLSVGEKTFNLGDDMVFYTSNNGTFSGEVVYVGFGLEDGEPM